MGSLFRDLNATARAFCSTKNELLVVMALSNQTLGFGKISDPLTDKRLVQLTGIRLDRLRPAVNSVIKKGLFDRKPHKLYGHEYSIGEVFLEEYQHKVYTPALSASQLVSEKQNPIFGKDRPLTQMGKDLTEKRTHTVTKHTEKKPSSQTQQQTNTKTKSSSIQPPQTQSVPLAEQQSVKLFFTDESDIPQNFAIETSGANTRIEFSFQKNTPQTNTTQPPVEPIKPPRTTTPKTTAKLKKLLKTVKKEPTSNVEKNVEKTPVIPPKPTPYPTKNREPWMDDALAAADYIDRQEEQRKAKEQQQVIEKPTVVTKPIPVKQTTPLVCGGDNKKEEKQEKPETIPLPTVVGEENYNACQRAFDALDNELKKKLLLVFYYNLKTRTVNNPAGYFITLARSTAEGGLTVPTGAIVKQPPTPKQKAAAKEQEDRVDKWSDFTWLQQNAELQGVEIKTLAEQMGEAMEAAYAMFAHTLETVVVPNPTEL